ncbi:MAG: glycosyltransferase family 9 protein [Ignavibacteria bacterium]|nr:MAG: glycosyltransferase family 9 protein [Ignavibacteria bacterium]
MTNKKLNILIVRTDRIGDVVLSLPLAAEIKKHYPDSKISFLVREYTSALLDSHPYVDDVILLPMNENKIDKKKIINELRNKNFDYGIVVYPTFEIAWILFRAGIKYRIGTGYRLYSFLFNKKIYEHRKSGHLHELEYNLNLLKLLGIEHQINKSNVSFNIHVDDNSKRKVDDFLSKNQYSKELPTVIVHPGSGGSAVDWPFSHFKELIDLLAQRLSINLIITGSESEKEMCEKLMNDKTINTAGEFNLSELIALIDNADVLIANSTGPIHIASGLGKHVIGFYPKIEECAPRRWGPYTHKSVVFSPEIDCHECTREQCERLNCMATIQPDEVFSSVEAIIAQITSGRN